MINVEQRKTQDDIHLNQKEASHKVWETGQLRRARMHVSCLVEDLDDKKALTSSLRKLLETSLILQTTSTKVLADYLSRSPANIRADFKQILSILGKHGSRSSLRATEGEGCLHS